MKTHKYHSILAFLAFCICTACTKDIGMEGLPQCKDYLKVYAIIGETATAEARNGETGGEETGGEGTTTPGNKDEYGTPMDELFSYKATNKGGGFVEGCQIGLYSVKNVNGVNNEKRLVNEPLTFIEKENNIGDTRIAGFKSDEIEIASMTNLGPTFVYYPYSADNDIKTLPEGATNWEYPINIYKASNQTPSTSGDQNKVIDLLTATGGGTLNSTYGVVLYTFKHACSMLMIHRGEGFDDKDSEVEVKIKNKLQAYVSRTTGSFSLKFKEAESTAADIPTVFPTNFCKNYKINATTREQDVYSVILPPGAIVEYIKMEDNFGTWQYIRPNDGDITLKEGWRQPVTVKMTGLYPTIYPHTISPWEDETITIDKNSAPGIYNSEDFMGWVEAYNTYKNNNSNETTLETYGTKDETGTWTFHLYTDIDFSEQPDASSTTECQYFIRTFTDKLEGHGHTLKNITLKKTSNTDSNVGFIGTLNGGSINNLKINGITVTATENVDANSYVGTLAGSITDGSITNCKITGINLECKQGYAGALAGQASAGTFETCLLEGELQLGKDATNDNNSFKLFGYKDESLTIESTKINTSGVYIFKEIETGTGSGDNETGQEGETTPDGNTGNNVEGGN